MIWNLLLTLVLLALLVAPLVLWENYMAKTRRCDMLKH